MENALTKLEKCIPRCDRFEWEMDEEWKGKEKHTSRMRLFSAPHYFFPHSQVFLSIKLKEQKNVKVNEKSAAR